MKYILSLGPISPFVGVMIIRDMQLGRPYNNILSRGNAILQATRETRDEYSQCAMERELNNRKDTIKIFNA